MWPTEGAFYLLKSRDQVLSSTKTEETDRQTTDRQEKAKTAEGERERRGEKEKEREKKKKKKHFFTTGLDPSALPADKAGRFGAGPPTRTTPASQC
jgi:hypothetical protein